MKKLLYAYLISLGIADASSFAMDIEKNEYIYDVPAIANKVFRVTPTEQLLAIKTENELTDEGIIANLIIRPDVSKRKAVDSLELTCFGAKGDKNCIKENANEMQLGAIALMRSDVSEALGGAHIPGDTIHIEGLRVGKKYISPGDIIVIRRRGTVKSILLKTYIPHHACWKLKARCGQEAFDFLNCGGAYENGYQSDRGLIHGENDHLRGLILAVLKEGEVNTGDSAVIERAEKKKLD